MRDTMVAGKKAGALGRREDLPADYVAGLRFKKQREHCQWLFNRSRAQPASRMSREEKLAALEITAEEFEWLMSFFGPHYSRLWQMKYDERLDVMDPEPEPWRALPAKLTGNNDGLLLDHFLKRRHVLSTERYFRRGDWHPDFEDPEHVAGVDRTAQLILDLDAHSVDQLRTLEMRYRIILGEARVPPVVFRTSRSHGLQLVWSLGGLADLREIRQRTLKALRQAGLVVPADVEIFPASRRPIRVPLGAHGELLDPESLGPVSGSFGDKFVEFTDQLKEQARYGFPLGLRRPRQRTAGVFRAGTVPVGESVPRNSPGSRMDRPAIDRKVFEEGLSPEYSRDEAVRHVIRHLYFQLHLTDERSLAQAVMDWLKEKHHGRSERYLTNRDRVENDVIAQVRKHLVWAKDRGGLSARPLDQSLRLTRPDYERIAEIANDIRADLAPNATEQQVVFGLAALFLYARQKCGPDLKDPKVPIPINTMFGFAYWQKDSKRSLYYGKWLEVLGQHKLLIDTGEEPIRGARTASGKGKCRTFILKHVFRGENLIKNHQEGFDLVLGPERVRERRKKKSTGQKKKTGEPTPSPSLRRRKG